MELLNSGNIDIGLVEGDVARQKMVVEKLIADELVLIVSPLHPWAKKKSISVVEITKEPFIFREEGSGTRQVIEKYLGKYRITPQDMMIFPGTWKHRGNQGIGRGHNGDCHCIKVGYKKRNEIRDP